MGVRALARPFVLAGIRNFGWVEPGVVARGEQPQLTEGTFAQLHEHGIRGVVSLRPDGEQPSPFSQRQWPEYHVREERELAEAAGLRFWHAPLEDYSAPPPEQLAQAVATLDEAVAAAPAVFVHCRAGAGRTAIATGAWAIAHGYSGDHVAASYEHYMLFTARSFPRPAEEVSAMLKRVGQPYVLWALQRVAEALGSPIQRRLEVLAAEEPSDAHDWADRYTEVLRPWRERRRHLEEQAS